MFSDPHPEHRINERFFTTLFQVLLETTLVGKEQAERGAFDALLRVANKLATTYLHLQKYRRVESSRLEAARRSPLRKIVPVSHDANLYRTCDDFLIQLRDGLNHVARFPGHFLENWPLSGMPESFDACLSSLNRAAETETDPGSVRSIRAVADMLKSNGEWIQGLLSLVADGLHPETFKVFVAALDESEPKDYLPMWSETEPVSVVLRNLWENFFLLAEVVLGSALACRLAPGIGIGYKFRSFDSSQSAWRLVKPERPLVARPDDVNAVRELLAVQQSERPMLQAIFMGKRFRIVGDMIIERPITETFSEFIWFLLRFTLGRDWWESERAKPQDERHQIVRWFDALAQWKRDSGREENRIEGGWHAVPSGDVQALTALAYDVYTLRHAVSFPNRLVARIKARAEFQGARYEIAAAAIVARAGFKLEFLERDRKHCEFLAGDPSGVRFGVEAKSRRRAGVLHEKGTLDPVSASRGDVQALFDDAKQQKPDGLPFVIFIDLNAPLPPRTTASPFETPWFDDVKACLDTHDATIGDRPDPFNAVIVTNFSTHYIGSEVAKRTGERVLIKGRRPADPLPEAILRRIWEAVERYGSAPEDAERLEDKKPEPGGESA